MIELRLSLQLDDGGEKFAGVVVRVELQAMFADCVGAVTAEGQFVQETLHRKEMFKEKLGEKQARVMYTM